MPSSMGGYPVSRETCGSVCMNAALFRPADDRRSMQLRAMVDREGACRLPPRGRTHHTLQAPGSLPWASRSLADPRDSSAGVCAPSWRRRPGSPEGRCQGPSPSLLVSHTTDPVARRPRNLPTRQQNPETLSPLTPGLNPTVSTRRPGDSPFPMPPPSPTPRHPSASSLLRHHRRRHHDIDPACTRPSGPRRDTAAPVRFHVKPNVPDAGSRTLWSQAPEEECTTE